jgi:exopolyphosphatase/guanosine-5'-triphosphate,3'-diphosphate pyrophosphatase
MAKVTTIIDIGSNSCRMIIVEKTSHFAFHLLKEIKSRVRISESAYENSGYLQQASMQRCFDALSSFIKISKSYKSRKVLCVATSAVRDAPNGKEFVKRVKDNLGLQIKIISGEQEALFGGIAVLNLLHLDNAVSIDIGGGSTEFVCIKDRNIKDKVSLNLGTVRLKELFNSKSLEEAKDFIIQSLETLPVEFKSSNLIGVGGSSRALAKLLIDSDYPIENVHGFSFSIERLNELSSKILSSTDEELSTLGIKKDRIDIIKEGTLIFSTICEYLGVQRITTSGVGVREGVYLHDLLRNYNYKFPNNFNLGIKSLCDRFLPNEKVANFNQSLSLKIFDSLKKYHDIDDKFKPYLKYATKLYNIGEYLGFYHKDKHTAYFIINNLHYGFSHSARLFIANLIYDKKKMPKFDGLDYLDILELSNEDMNRLRFILSLSNLLNVDHSLPKLKFEYSENCLRITSKEKLYLCENGIEKVNKLDNNLNIEFIYT